MLDLPLSVSSILLMATISLILIIVSGLLLWRIVTWAASNPIAPLTKETNK